MMNKDEQRKMIFKRIISRHKDYSVCSALTMQLLCETQGISIKSSEKREFILCCFLFFFFFAADGVTAEAARCLGRDSHLV